MGYAKKMVNRDFGQDGKVGASVEVGKKDLGLIENLYAGTGSSDTRQIEEPTAKRPRLEASAHDCLPIVSAARAHMDQQCANLRGSGLKEADREWCSFLEAMERSR